MECMKGLSPLGKLNQGYALCITEDAKGGAKHQQIGKGRASESYVTRWNDDRRYA